MTSHLVTHSLAVPSNRNAKHTEDIKAEEAGMASRPTKRSVKWVPNCDDVLNLKEAAPLVVGKSCSWADKKSS